MRALVVFHGQPDHPLAFLLRPGFRHCFVCVLAGPEPGYWVSIDPTTGPIAVAVECGPAYDLRAYYEELGCTVVETHTCLTPPRWPFALANCTGAVKAVLGLRAPFVITPYQLYRRLK